MNNINKLVMNQVSVTITHPKMPSSGYRVGNDGKGRITNGTGGITYNYKIGDNCMDLAGDHVEPCVSSKNNDSSYNAAVQHMACIGNIATITSGKAIGSTGIVTGKHGGVDHTMIHFDNDIVEQLNIGDNISIKTFGLGLKLNKYPNITFMSIDPNLLNKFTKSNNKLEFKVTHIIPAHLMGSGLGSSTLFSGDYDIMTQDKSEVERLNLNSLRFGDIVAIENHDTTYGAHFKKDSISIGVITHSDSFTSGHGPGVTIIASGTINDIELIIDSDSNLINYI